MRRYVTHHFVPGHSQFNLWEVAHEDKINRGKLKESGLLSNRIRDVREIWYRYHMNGYKSKWNIDLRDYSF